MAINEMKQRYKLTDEDLADFRIIDIYDSYEDHYSGRLILKWEDTFQRPIISPGASYFELTADCTFHVRVNPKENAKLNIRITTSPVSFNMPKLGTK